MDNKTGFKRETSGCVDGLALQQLLDGELDMAAAELLMHHLKSCSECAPAYHRLREERLFCAEQLGLEDEVSESATRSVLQRTRLNLEEAIRPVGKMKDWRRRWLAIAASVLILASLLSPFLTITVDASAEEILSESSLRERVWVARPNTILRWTIVSAISGGSSLPDGVYRATQWQNNYPGQMGSIIRRYDEQGQLVWARWIRADGSEISYNHFKGDLLQIGPPITEMEQALPSLEPHLRTVLASELAKSRRAQSPQLLGQEFADRFKNSMHPSNGGTTMTLEQTPEWGPVFHIRTDRSGKVTRYIQDTYIGASDFKRYRLKSAHYGSNGSVYLEDAQGMDFQETTIEDFEANTLTDIVASSTNIVRLSPRDVALLVFKARGGLTSLEKTKS